MQIHNIKRKTPNKKVMIVGRGGKRGKTSGRGGKGQTARSGHKVRPEWRDFIKRMPKLRGYSFQSITGVRNPVVAINLDLINAAFKMRFNFNFMAHTGIEQIRDENLETFWQ
jgi:large subunit ribosomal protein L15